MVKLLFENEGGCVKFLDNLNDDLTSFRFATNLNFSRSFEEVIVTEKPVYITTLVTPAPLSIPMLQRFLPTCLNSLELRGKHLC